MKRSYYLQPAERIEAKKRRKPRAPRPTFAPVPESLSLSLAALYLATVRGQA